MPTELHNDDGLKLVMLEFREINNNVRFLYDKYMQWVVWFNAANTATLGWFINQFFSDKPFSGPTWIVWLIAGFFIIQVGFAIGGSAQFNKRVKMHRERMDRLASILSSRAAAHTEDPFPFSLTERLITLFSLSFVPLIFVWLAFAWVLTNRANHATGWCCL